MVGLNSGYSISNYGIFDDAIGLTSNLSNTLSDVKSKLISSSEKLTDNTFKGLTGDQAQEYYEKISSYFDVMDTVFTKINNFLRQKS